jgi:hypothetical protein
VKNLFVFSNPSKVPYGRIGRAFLKPIDIPVNLWYDNDIKGSAFIDEKQQGRT